MKGLFEDIFCNNLIITLCTLLFDVGNKIKEEKNGNQHFLHFQPGFSLI